MSEKIRLTKNIKALITNSSINLVYVTSDGLPAGGGSGCLIDYYGKRYLLTVEHVVNHPRAYQLLVVMGWDAESRKTELRTPGRPVYAQQGMMPEGAVDLDGLTLQSIDLAYFEVPYNDIPKQQIITRDGTVRTSTPLTVWTDKQLTTPEIGCKCGFAGHTSHDTKFDARIANDVYLQYSLFRKCYDLTFEGAAGDFYAFKLPFSHPGVGFFEGCSGAPIIDQNGNVVALVSHGREENGVLEDYIYGVPIDKYKLVMDTNRLILQWQEGGKPYLES